MQLGGYQVTCLCRNLVIPYGSVGKDDLRRAWEIAVGLRSKHR